MFNNIHFVFEMETMKRFTEPVLITILHKMRQPKGAKLTDQEWQALQNTELDATQLEHDPKAFLQETAGWFESSYLWSIVSMACYSRALASARQHERTLFFFVRQLTTASKCQICAREDGTFTSKCSLSRALLTPEGCQAWCCFTLACGCGLQPRFCHHGPYKMQQGPLWKSKLPHTTGTAHQTAATHILLQKCH